MDGCPDFSYIREKVPITQVARELGIPVNGYRARCWRAEAHRNGDIDPSIRFHRKTNRGRCFVCDPYGWSTIDLVMRHRGCTLLDAVRWLADRFFVPRLPIGRHGEKRSSWTPRLRASESTGIVELLVRSGIWAFLTHAENSLIPVLVTFTDSQTGVAEISFVGLMRYSGIGSTATVSKALRHFQQMGFLQIIKSPSTGVTRAVNKYRLCPDEPQFLELVNSVFRQQRAEIELERTLRAEAKKARTAQRLPV